MATILIMPGPHCADAIQDMDALGYDTHYRQGPTAEWLEAYERETARTNANVARIPHRRRQIVGIDHDQGPDPKGAA